MNLTVDIGNTRVKFGVFDGSDLVFASAYSHHDAAHGYHGLTSLYTFGCAIISSVGNTDPGLSIEAGALIHLDHNTPLPVKNAYATPETLGRDRIAAVVGAHRLFPGQNVLVIDAGTCITYDLVTSDGVYQGGNIAPGLDMRLRAMHEQTAKLPLVGRAHVEDVVGKTTQEALQNGAEKGVLFEIEGYKTRLEKEESAGIVTVMTGGDASYLSEKLKTEIFVRPNLVLIGLNEILIHNVA